MTSPRVTELTWGHVEVEGLGGFKDVKLWPGGGRKWDWNETGTRHSPGVQLDDVAELLEHGAEVVVLSRGMTGALGVPPETVHELEKTGITVHVHRTKRAVALYNELAETSVVGALLHSTC
jgi:hypothetical protein